MESIDALLVGDSTEFNSTPNSSIINDASTVLPTHNTQRRFSGQNQCNDKSHSNSNNVTNDERTWQRSSIASSNNDDKDRSNKQDKEVIYTLEMKFKKKKKKIHSFKMIKFMDLCFRVWILNH